MSAHKRKPAKEVLEPEEILDSQRNLINIFINTRHFRARRGCRSTKTTIYCIRQKNECNSSNIKMNYNLKREQLHCVS